MTQRRSSRSRIQILALMVTLGLALVGLTQCRSISDKISGVELRTAGSLSGRSDCTRQCNETYKAGQRAEQARHAAALRQCGKDKDCKKDEDRQHKKILDGLSAEKRACKKGCYNEGSGSGI